MGCLDTLVGVRGCGSETRDFYVNDLTGIKIPDFDKAISPEHKNASAALTDIVSFATKYVERTISNHLGTKYQLKSFIENNAVGYFYDNKETVAAQPTYLTGYEIKIDSVPYLNLFIQGLRLFVNTTGTVQVKIYDLIQGKVVSTADVSALAGEIVNVNGLDLSFATNKQRLHLFIGYQSTFESYKTSYLPPYYSFGTNESCGDNNCGTYRNGYVYFRAAKMLSSASPIARSLEDNDYGSGLSFNYSLQCSFTEVMCNARNLFALPILYKAGELIMKEMLNSKRLTGVVTSYAKNNEELMKDYQAEYTREMESLLMNMNLPESVCFGCTPAVKTRVVLP